MLGLTWRVYRDVAVKYSLHMILMLIIVCLVFSFIIFVCNICFLFLLLSLQRNRYAVSRAHWAAWLPGTCHAGGPVGLVSRWAATSNVEVNQTTYAVTGGRVGREGREGS